MIADLDALLQQGLKDRSWGAVIEQLRKSDAVRDADPAETALEQLRAEVRDLVRSLSGATSVADVNKAGRKLNDRIEMMKGLETALAEERPLATANSG